MERAGVAGDGQTDAAGDGDELGERADERSGGAGGLANDYLGERLLAGADVDENAAAVGDERLSHGGVALGWPAFCTPAGAGVDKNRWLVAGWRQDFVGPGFGGGVDGQQR